MRLIDAETVVHISTYDEEFEEQEVREMTVEEILDTFTDEGCPDGTEPIRLNDDGTLWVTVEDCEKVERVIVGEHDSKWCRIFHKGNLCRFYGKAEPKGENDA